MIQKAPGQTNPIGPHRGCQECHPGIGAQCWSWKGSDQRNNWKAWGKSIGRVDELSNDEEAANRLCMEFIIVKVVGFKALT
jgi:hypothetical protein